MNRKILIALSVVSALSLLSADAKAQWGYGSYGAGYGGYGWGGWGSTVGGDMARGLGALYSGAGIYNQETAVANSINADTVMRFNEYLYQSQMVSTRKYHQIANARLAKDNAAYDALLKRLRESPTAREIQNGDALNIALDQLGDPRIHSSALRLATEPVDAQLIRDIPFRNASEAITITLSQFKNAAKWPTALRGERFAEDHRDFERLIESARKQDETGEVSPETLDQLHGVVNRVKQKIKSKPLAEDDQKEANTFLKGITALLRMVEMPDVKAVLDELRQMKSTSLGNLMAFMHTFNLRFGPAETPRQRMIYDKLYPLIDQSRDRILAELKPAPSNEAKADGADDIEVQDFFSAMDPKHLERKKRSATPKPPAPKTPAPAPDGDR
jgi:hypothetical protein